MPNAYITLTTLKGSAGLDIAGTAYDTRLLGLLENISRQIDRHTDRIFYYLVEVRTFSGPGLGTLLVPDLVALPSSAIVEDTNADGTYETVWSNTDYLLAPYNANPTSTYGTINPYRKLEVNRNSNGTQDTFLRGQQNYSITGTWGYSRVLFNTTEKTSASLDSTATTFNVTAASTLSAGQTIIIDSEVMYISSTGTGTNMTVTRAVNGSPAATHTMTSNVNSLVFPGPIQEAVFIQASRLWKRRDSGFASQVGLPETGQFVVFSGGLDADVKALLSPYIRYSAG